MPKNENIHIAQKTKVQIRIEDFDILYLILQNFSIISGMYRKDPPPVLINERSWVFIKIVSCLTDKIPSKYSSIEGFRSFYQDILTTKLGSQ